jgi:hypothetical protein
MSDLFNPIHCLFVVFLTTNNRVSVPRRRRYTREESGAFWGQEYSYDCHTQETSLG